MQCMTLCVLAYHMHIFVAHLYDLNVEAIYVGSKKLPHIDALGERNIQSHPVVGSQAKSGKQGRPAGGYNAPSWCRVYVHSLHPPDSIRLAKSLLSPCSLQCLGCLHVVLHVLFSVSGGRAIC